MKILPDRESLHNMVDKSRIAFDAFYIKDANRFAGHICDTQKEYESLEALEKELHTISAKNITGSNPHQQIESLKEYQIAKLLNIKKQLTAYENRIVSKKDTELSYPNFTHLEKDIVSNIQHQKKEIDLYYQSITENAELQNLRNIKITIQDLLNIIIENSAGNHIDITSKMVPSFLERNHYEGLTFYDLPMDRLFTMQEIHDRVYWAYSGLKTFTTPCAKVYEGILTWIKTAIVPFSQPNLIQKGSFHY